MKREGKREHHEAEGSEDEGEITIVEERPKKAARNGLGVAAEVIDLSGDD